MKGDTYVRTVVTAYRKVIDAHNSSPKARKAAHDEAAALLDSAFNRSYQDDFLRGMVHRRTLTEKNPSGRQTAADAAVGLTRKIPIYAHVDVDGDGRLELTLWDEKAHTAVVAADFQPQPASKRPATIDYLKKQLGRLGETPFALAEVTAWDETKMIPASVLNDLRRQAVDALTEVILADYSRPSAGKAVPVPERADGPERGRAMELVARCDTVDAVMAAAEHGADVVIFGGESYHHRPFLKEDWQVAVKAAHDHGAALWAGTPRIVREGIEGPYRVSSNEPLRPVSTAFTSEPWLSLRWLKRLETTFLSGPTGPSRLQQPSCLDLCGPRLQRHYGIA